MFSRHSSIASFVAVGLAGAALAQDLQPPKPDDRYKLGPDSQRQAGGAEGKVTEYEWKDSKIYPGTVRNFWVYVPAQYDATKPAARMVFRRAQSEAWRVHFSRGHALAVAGRRSLNRI